jgi:hypothetical protein
MMQRMAISPLLNAAIEIKNYKKLAPAIILPLHPRREQHRAGLGKAAAPI